MRTGPVHPIVFHNIMDALPVNGWQVVPDVDGLHVLLSGGSGVLNEERLIDTVRQALARQGAVVPPVGIQQVPSIAQSASGKTPLVKCNLPADHP